MVAVRTEVNQSKKDNKHQKALFALLNLCVQKEVDFEFMDVIVDTLNGKSLSSKYIDLANKGEELFDVSFYES